MTDHRPWASLGSSGHTWAETVLEMSRGRGNKPGLSCTDPGEGSGTGAPPGTIRISAVARLVTFQGAQSRAAPAWALQPHLAWILSVPGMLSEPGFEAPALL